MSSLGIGFDDAAGRADAGLPQEPSKVTWEGETGYLTAYVKTSGCGVPSTVQYHLLLPAELEAQKFGPVELVVTGAPLSVYPMTQGNRTPWVTGSPTVPAPVYGWWSPEITPSGDIQVVGVRVKTKQYEGGVMVTTSPGLGATLLGPNTPSWATVCGQARVVCVKRLNADGSPGTPPRFSISAVRWEPGVYVLTIDLPQAEARYNAGEYGVENFTHASHPGATLYVPEVPSNFGQSRLATPGAYSTPVQVGKTVAIVRAPVMTTTTLALFEVRDLLGDAIFYPIEAEFVEVTCRDAYQFFMVYWGFTTPYVWGGWNFNTTLTGFLPAYPDSACNNSNGAYGCDPANPICGTATYTGSTVFNWSPFATDGSGGDLNILFESSASIPFSDSASTLAGGVTASGVATYTKVRGQTNTSYSIALTRTVPPAIGEPGIVNTYTDQSAFEADIAATGIGLGMYVTATVYQNVFTQERLCATCSTAIFFRGEDVSL